LNEARDGLVCNFCEQAIGEDRRGVAGNRGAICWDCLELCLTIVKLDGMPAFEGMVERARAFVFPSQFTTSAPPKD
jgi:hypothetical protein